ncbi:MAG: lactonase family protein [Treponema sp.]|jgi:6-phosphogluconolactonase|nr:lactonase family protein [Treponema sp.]
MLYSFYVGCYTKNPEDKGIHLLGFDTESGGLQVADSFYGGESPSFLIRSGDFLYAANETGSTGKVSALSCGAGNTLAFINSREAAGADTCHIAEKNGFLYAANYGSGSIFGVEILPDGSLGNIAAEIQHQGTGPNQRRQKGPHAHSVNPVPNNDLLIACDLGTDSLFCYHQQKDGALVPDGAVAAPAGGGPRHLAFHPNGKWVYAVMEMGVSLVCYKFTEKGLEQGAVYPLIAEEFTQADSAADIHLTADGKRLYATVRGKNLISGFDVGGDASVGFIGSYPTFGNSPRNFCFSPDEKFVVIAHQASGHVAVCPVDLNGAVGKAVGSVILPGASCVIKA